MTLFSDASPQVRAPTGTGLWEAALFLKINHLEREKIDILHLEDPKPDDFSLSL